MTAIMPSMLRPRILLEKVLEELGDRPIPQEHLKKTRHGLKVISSITDTQFTMGFCLFMLSIVFFGFAFELSGLLGDVLGMMGGSLRTFQFVGGFAAMFVTLGFAVYLISTFRTVYLDPIRPVVQIRNTKFFIPRMEIYRKDQLKAVFLNGIFTDKKKDDIESIGLKWKFGLELRDGTVILFTKKLFSRNDEFNALGVTKEKDYRLCKEFPFKAWILCQALGVPLHFVTRSKDLFINSRDEIPTYGENAKQSFKDMDIRKIPARNKLRIYFLFAGFLLGLKLMTSFTLLNGLDYERYPFKLTISMISLALYIVVFIIILTVMLYQNKKRPK